jgi:DNA invertase Pin-like site-specific DNA recombinase
MRRRSTDPAGAAHPAGAAPIAYSYIRFSSLPQEAGDSIRRQIDLTRNWAQRHNARLDESLKIDRGVSAFRGKNRDVGALGEFLRLVEGGRVPPGSYLVVESLDRLTREEVLEAAHLIFGMILKGVRIVQLQPELVYDRASCSGPMGMGHLMLMIADLSRGHGESALKSERVGAAWAEKRRRARAGEAQNETARMGKGCQVMTHRMPGWLRMRGGKPELIPERAAALRQAVRLLASGYGYTRTVRRLNEGDVPAPRGGRWRSPATTPR